VKNAQNTTGRGAGYIARIAADEAQARCAGDRLAESLDPTAATCAVYARPDGGWQIDIHFNARPDLARLRKLVALAGGDALAKRLKVEPLPARDWVADSLAGLKPVRAGRFVVHGAHDRAAVGGSELGIEIEAANAFGTGHHGTTRGCLLALDTLARQKRPRHVLDLGTGSGVLAIAAAKVFRVPVLATDIDPVAARAARANARHNGVAGLVTTVHATGLRAPQIAARAPFDLVLANVLLGPLQRLAAPMARQIMPNAHVVLSGLLAVQAKAAIAAYRSQGLVLERSIALDGWSTLVLQALSA
jgi:ribosomal protein L11 methyltransferase